MIPSGATKSPTQAFSNTKSLQFDGVDEYVNTTLDLSAQSFTVSFWLKFDNSVTASFMKVITISPSSAAPNQTIGRIYKSGANNYLITQAYDDNGLNFSNYIVDGFNLGDNQWHHVAITYQYDAVTLANNKHYVYIDGTNYDWKKFSSADRTPAVTLQRTSTRDLVLGAYTGGSEPYIGNLDEISIYNSILTSEQITAISTTPIDLSSYSPTMWFRNGDGDTYPTITDNGSGGNDGTMIMMESGDIINNVP